MIIRNEFIVTKALFTEWGKENERKGARLIFKIFCCVFAVVMIILAVLFFAKLGFVNGYAMYFLLLAVFCVYRGVFRNRALTLAQYRKNSELFGGENWKRIVEFTDDEIVTVNGNITVKNNYSEITSVRRSGNKIWLDTDKGMVIRLYADSFTQGSFEELERLIEDKAKIKNIIRLG